jgi:acetyl esterase/lipase
VTRSRRSIRSALLALAVPYLGYQRELRSAERTLRRAEEHRLRPERFAPPRRLGRRVVLGMRRVAGWPVYTVRPRAGTVGARALYVHGGAWVHEISLWHWRLIADLAVRAGAEVTVPVYPLVPVGTAGEVVPGVAGLLEELVAAAGPERVTVLGDSAGGTIALAAAMLVRDRGVAPATARIVLIAPSLDLRFTDPLIPRIQRKDPWLAVPGPRAAAELWRGDLPLESPTVSPLFGSLAGLGRITVFTGTHDITNADAHALVRRARAAGHPLDLHERPNLLHDYPLQPIPEGADARRIIAAIVRGDPAGRRQAVRRGPAPY